MPNKQIRAATGFGAGDVVQRVRTGVSVLANATIASGTPGVVIWSGTLTCRFAYLPSKVHSPRRRLEPLDLSASLTASLGPARCEADSGQLR
jgi:hypothetical protein